MLKIGITGQTGFIGTNLYNSLGLFPKEFQRINFRKEYFEADILLNDFVSQCDIIVHTAALNRHNDPKVIYDTNIGLVNKLIRSLCETNSKAHVIFTSSTQEENDNLYGKSKKDGRELMLQWSKKAEGKFTGLIIPNVFGPFGHPNYNSVVATFCHQLAHNEIPTIAVDGEVKLIYVGELVELLLSEIRSANIQAEILVPFTTKIKVSKILNLLEKYKSEYQEKGEIPFINSRFELNLFNTYRCYMDIKNHFPVKYTQHIDPRGSFVEVIRLGVGGQVSYSTTVPGITRGNHYHTRKIERFAVIKGKALIQLRRIGTNEILNFYLDGDTPSYVDMPIWFTHNIKNIGDELLYTNFWINEFYDPNDTDTYFENV